MQAVLAPWPSPSTPVRTTRSGDRRGLWTQLLAQLPSTVSHDEERAKIKNLAEGGCWLQGISAEHADIYRAIYQESKEVSWRGTQDSNIERDVPRTYGAYEANLMDKLRHKLEAPRRYAALHRMLSAVSRITSGYCQGMNFIAGLLVLELWDEEEAFLVFAHMLRGRHLDALFEGQGEGLLAFVRLFERIFNQHLPRLHSHFESQHFGPLLYAVEWFTTVFSISLPRTLALCAFDLYLAGVDDLLLRLGVSLLAEAQHDLLRLDAEGLQQDFKAIISRLPTERVLLAAISTRVPLRSNRLLEVKMGLERGTLRTVLGEEEEEEEEEEEAEGQEEKKGEEESGHQCGGKLPLGERPKGVPAWDDAVEEGAGGRAYDSPEATPMAADRCEANPGREESA